MNKPTGLLCNKCGMPMQSGVRAHVAALYGDHHGGGLFQWCGLCWEQILQKETVPDTVELTKQVNMYQKLEVIDLALMDSLGKALDKARAENAALKEELKAKAEPIIKGHITGTEISPSFVYDESRDIDTSGGGGDNYGVSE
jgi:hypothetical protein